MRRVRPWEIFQHLPGDRDVLYRIPSHRGTESETVMSLETMLLIAAARIVNAQTIFEFGTGLGYNAFNLARNTEAIIETVDDARKWRAFEDTEYENRIAPITMRLDDVVPDASDMVFCDINCSLKTLTQATTLAFACFPKVIAWHDYGNPLGPWVKPYLDELSETADLIHVEDSWIVLWFKGGL